MNARKESNIKYPSSDTFLEIDLWIPSLNLGFEYQVIIIIIIMRDNGYND